MIGGEDLELILHKDNRQHALNSGKNFNIRKKALDSLSYVALQYIFHGMNNFDFPEFYVFLNPAEILGFWAGLRNKELYTFNSDGTPQNIIPVLIRHGYVLSRTKNKKIYSLEMIDEELEKHSVNVFRKDVSTIERRIESLPDLIKKRLIHELGKPYKYSDSENQELASYHDPCFDGSNHALYAGRIMLHIRNEYEKLKKRYSLKTTTSSPKAQ